MTNIYLYIQLHGDSDTYEQAKKTSQQLNFKIVRIITMPHQKARDVLILLHQIYISLFHCLKMQRLF